MEETIKCLFLFLGACVLIKAFFWLFFGGGIGSLFSGRPLSRRGATPFSGFDSEKPMTTLLGSGLPFLQKLQLFFDFLLVAAFALPIIIVPIYMFATTPALSEDRILYIKSAFCFIFIIDYLVAYASFCIHFLSTPSEMKAFLKHTWIPLLIAVVCLLPIVFLR